jgi:hypothetical protein
MSLELLECSNARLAAGVCSWGCLTHQVGSTSFLPEVMRACAWPQRWGSLDQMESAGASSHCLALIRGDLQRWLHLASVKSALLLPAQPEVSTVKQQQLEASFMDSLDG